MDNPETLATLAHRTKTNKTATINTQRRQLKDEQHGKR